jgi:hypothetical protein
MRLTPDGLIFNKRSEINMSLFSSPSCRILVLGRLLATLDLFHGIILIQKGGIVHPEFPADNDSATGKAFFHAAAILEWKFGPQERIVRDGGVAFSDHEVFKE